MSGCIYVIGLISVWAFGLLGVATCLAAFAYLFKGASDRPEEWEECETHEVDRSVTVEEYLAGDSGMNPPTTSVLVKRQTQSSRCRQEDP